MQPSYPTRSFRDKSLVYLAPLLAIVVAPALLLAGCGGATTAPNPTDTPISNTNSGSLASASSTNTPIPPSTASSSSNSGQSTPAEQASAPLIPSDGTLRTAMQRVDEAEGLKFTLEYTNTTGSPHLDYGFKIVGEAAGKLLPNRKSHFNLTMTKGNKGAKQQGEWILYWDFDQNKAFFKVGGQWQAVNTGDLHSDPTNFDPMFAYNELGQYTTFGVVDINGKANPDLLTQIASMYTLSGTEQLNGEDVDHYHLVGEAGGVLDAWVGKKSGDIVKFQNDVTSNGLGTFASLTLSDIGQTQSVQTPK